MVHIHMFYGLYIVNDLRCKRISLRVHDVYSVYNPQSTAYHILFATDTLSGTFWNLVHVVMFLVSTEVFLSSLECRPFTSCTVSCTTPISYVQECAVCV